jgi:hypothetical protein
MDGVFEGAALVDFAVTERSGGHANVHKLKDG